uniref:Transcription initiation factor IID subunit A family protein n=1 Tax=Rhizophora mucronata TaxID=61149 RepID=A0A2P2IWP3_RHIMU
MGRCPPCPRRAVRDKLVPPIC